MNSKASVLAAHSRRQSRFDNPLNRLACAQTAALFTLNDTMEAVSPPICAGDEDEGLSIVDIRDAQTPAFRKLWMIYNLSFPEDERRSFLEHERLLDDPRFHFGAICDEGVVVGLVSHWELHDMLFIEHLAIAPEHRSAGHGGRALEHLQYYADRMIVLDVEPAEESPIAARRVRFYMRHGFRYCHRSVELPTYWFAKPAPSHLMVWAPNNVKLTQKQIMSMICRGIYNLDVAVAK
ncbi:MAG: GNAT family N-acetyltransferase [Kiritimatiellia bacterium]